ncbi:MAG: Hpt domain-containing protein [Chloroflexi bacterium]|nr:Hpt domain-containing protein [Chloroflexota bacterium]
MSSYDDLLESLDALGVYDTDAIAALRDPELGGDAAFLAEVVEAFLEDAPEHVGMLRAAFPIGDAPSVMRAAHSLKGSSGNFGAARLRALCAALEQHARANHLEGLDPVMNRLDVEFCVLKKQLKALVVEAERAQASAG